MRKRLATILSLVFVLGGCQTAEPAAEPTTRVAETTVETAVEATTEALPVTEAEAVTEIKTTEPETTTAAETTETAVEMSDKMAELITEDQTLSGIGDYIREHMDEATPEEAEEMIFWLKVYQSKTIQEMRNRIYTEKYLTALNRTMGGILDPDKIDEIEDEAVREDYQTMVDGFLTIVRYEETPSVEMDWAALQAYKASFDEVLGTVVSLNAARKEYEYKSDFNQAAEDTAAVEVLIESTDYGFKREMLTTLHEGLMGDLFVGPEGMYIDLFVEKGGSEYEALIAFAEDYPEAKLSGLIVSLDSETWSDYSGPSRAVDVYKSVLYGNKILWEEEKISNESMEANLQTAVLETMPTTADKINEQISVAVEELSLSANDYYSVNIYPYYNDSRWASVGIFLETKGDEPQRFDCYMNFNMDSGGPVTINDYLGMDEQSAIETINMITGDDYTLLPQFIFYEEGVYLIPQEDDPIDVDFSTLSLKDLIPYVDKSDLIR